MDEFKLEIKKVFNGYVLKGRFGDMEHEIETIIEESETESGELEAMEKLLLEVKEYFGIYYSKHNKKNLEINIVENIN